MVHRQYALVDGALLRWARESARFDPESAAKKLGVPAQRLDAWERGDLRPTMNQLRKLANTYKRPIAVFYLPEPPTESQALRDFRVLSTSGRPDSVPELAYEIRKVQARRDLAAELYEASVGFVAEFPLVAEPDEEPEVVAARIREFLGVSVDAQVSWADGYPSLNAWRGVLEDAGILSFQFANVPLEVARGFSVYARTLPAVAANSKDAVHGRVFTLLHEIGHLALRQGGLCDLLEADSASSTGPAIEAFCNAVAGATLVPVADLMSHPDVRGHRGAEWRDDEINPLARRYGVSREVVLRRLLSQGLTTAQHYQLRRRQLQEEYAGLASPGGPVPQHLLVLSRNGRLFTQLVLENFHRGYVTGSDVAEFLDVRLKHLGEIQNVLAKRVS